MSNKQAQTRQTAITAACAARAFVCVPTAYASHYKAWFWHAVHCLKAWTNQLRLKAI